MDRENLLIYVTAWDNYQRGNTVALTDLEKKVCTAVNILQEKNPELKTFIRSLARLNYEEKVAAVNAYFKKDEEPELEENNDGMITIEEIKDYPEIVGTMSPVETKKLNYLINNSRKLRVKKLNLKDLSYINEDDKLIEVIYDEDRNEIRTTDPDLLDYTQEIVRPETVDIEEEKIEVNEPEEITFIAPPKALVKHAKKKQKAQKSGYVSAFLLFALTGFAGGVIATVLTLILS